MAKTKSRGAVAAGHEQTVKAAAQVLKDGGNAFDAAIAGLWVACVAEPVLISPGGGGFVMTMSGQTGEVVLLDFFAQTPGGKKPVETLDFYPVHADFGTVEQEFHIGLGASAVPGFVPGLYALHDAFATRPMADLLEPATNLARRGLPVTSFQAFVFEVVAPIVTATQSARALFAPTGALLREGETFFNSGLAGYFDGLAHDGLDFYHHGGPAHAIVDAQSGGGHLTRRDFANYGVVKRQPIIRMFNGARIFLNPPPSAGGGLIAYALNAFGTGGDAGAPRLARALLATDLIRQEAKNDISVVLAALGDDRGPSGPAPVSTRGTTHISVIDDRGNAVAASVSNGEGNGVIIGDCGFMMNNMLGEQDVNPHGFHQWREGVRLASMMAPSLILEHDGALTALGSGGSNRIRSAIFAVIARLVDQGLDPARCVEAARLHVENEHLDFEDFVSASERRDLVKAFPDHRAWDKHSLFFGGVHVAQRRADGTFEGAGDPRRAGVFSKAG